VECSARQGVASTSRPNRAGKQQRLRSLLAFSLVDQVFERRAFGFEALLLQISWIGIRTKYVDAVARRSRGPKEIPCPGAVAAHRAVLTPTRIDAVTSIPVPSFGQSGRGFRIGSARGAMNTLTTLNQSDIVV